MNRLGLGLRIGMTRKFGSYQSTHSPPPSKKLNRLYQQICDDLNDDHKNKYEQSKNLSSEYRGRKMAVGISSGFLSSTLVFLYFRSKF